jgi:hypothetical protein
MIRSLLAALSGITAIGVTTALIGQPPPVPIAPAINTSSKQDRLEQRDTLTGQDRKEPHRFAETVPPLYPYSPPAQNAPAAFPEPVAARPPERTRVATTPIAAEPSQVTAEVPSLDRPHRRHRGRDICEAHGLHKVVTRGGRSWRCMH